MAAHRRSLARLRSRYYDVLASVYLYNEYQGYKGLERLLVAIRPRYPAERDCIGAVEKHTEDERKHYRMFKSYFEAQATMLLALIVPTAISTSSSTSSLAARWRTSTRRVSWRMSTCS